MKTFRYDNFLLCIFIWVLLVSMLDHYLTIKLESTILGEEKNPIGLSLIKANGGSVALFMTIKMLFLWMIAGILLILYQFKKRMAYAGVIALGIVQLWLVSYFLKSL